MPKQPLPPAQYFHIFSPTLPYLTFFHNSFHLMQRHFPSNMKNRASTFLKQIFSVITTVVKAKSAAVKSKTSAIKTRLLVFGLLRNKKVLMSAISHKIHALMGQEKGGSSQGSEDNGGAIVLHDAARDEAPQDQNRTEIMEPEEEEEDDGYPDLRHSLFDLEDDDDDELGDGTGSVIDLVKNSREDGADFKLEDEIDLVADVFIRRFHKQMRMQKMESFKRYREMLERSV